MVAFQAPDPVACGSASRSRSLPRALAILGAATLACSTPPAEPSEPEASAGDLAGRFFRHPTLHLAELSPDGTRLAAVRSHGAEDTIVVIPLSDGQPGEAIPLVSEERGKKGHKSSRTIRTLQWANNERILFAIDTPLLSREDSWERYDGRGTTSASRGQRGRTLHARKTRLYAVGLEGRSRWIGKRWRNAEHSVYQHQILSRPRDGSSHALLSYENDVLRVRVTNGSARVLLDWPRTGYVRWHADHLGDVRFRTSYRHWTTRRTFEYRDPSRQSWETLLEFDEYLEHGFEYAGYGGDPDTLEIYSNLGPEGSRDKKALFEYDLQSRTVGRLLLADPDYDVDSDRLLHSPVDGRLLAISYYREGREVHIVDEAWRSIWERLVAALPGRDIYVQSFDEKATRALVWAASQDAPPSLHLYDAASQRITEIADLHPQLRDLEYGSRTAIRYRAPDGTQIEALVTHPPGCREPGPVVVMPHDGPDERDWLGWDSTAQYLALRGFHVFQPNFRGSSGYGWSFERAGDREWSGAIQDDIRAGVLWMVEEGVADPERIGIFGEGFGGYAALLALARSPELYRAGASLGGMTNLLDHMGYEEGYVRAGSVNEHVIGDPLADRAAIRDASPIKHADRIDVPVLLGHGSENPTVHVRQSKSMARALEKRGIPVEIHVYEGATDRFLDDRQQVDFFRRLGDFFERHLAERGP